MIEENAKASLRVVFFFMGGGLVGGPPFDPDEITSHLGIEPDESWSVGARLQPIKGVTLIPSQTSGWFLWAQGAPDDELENQVRSLLDRIRPVEESIRRLQAKYVSGLDCLLDADAGQFHPRLVLPVDILDRLASLHLRIGFSVRCYPIAGGPGLEPSGVG